MSATRQVKSRPAPGTGKAADDNVFDDPRWDALSDGTATPAQIAELREWAERSTKAKEAFAAFQPVTRKELDQIAEGVLASFTARKQPVVAVPEQRNVLAGKYRLTHVLRRGATAAVWEAEDILSGQIVVVKRRLARANDPENDSRERLLREARVLGKLKHPNIVRALDTILGPTGEPFLVMEQLRGQTLADLLQLKKRLEPALAIRIAREVAAALAAAHEKQIVHRHIAPLNIFLHQEVDADPTSIVVKLLGFGSCKDLEQPDALVTNSSRFVGGMGYMSPEQVGMRGEIDTRTDIWSLGLVFYEMLTGSRPSSVNEDDMARQILLGYIPPPSNKIRTLPRSLDDIVIKCTEPEREKRIQHVTAVHALLVAVESTLLAEATHQPNPANDALRINAATTIDGSDKELLLVETLAPARERKNRAASPYRLTNLSETGHLLREPPHRELIPTKSLSTVSDTQQTQSAHSSRRRHFVAIVAACVSTLGVAALALINRSAIASVRYNGVWAAGAIALIPVTAVAIYFYTRSRKANEYSMALLAGEQKALSLIAANQALEAKMTALEMENEQKAGWLDQLEDELTWAKAELEDRPKLERRVYKIITIGAKGVGKSSLVPDWSNPLFPIGPADGPQIERYELTISQVRNRNTLVEYVLQVHDWASEHIVHAQQELIIDDISGLLFVVDLAAEGAKQVDLDRIGKQLNEFNPQALRYFFSPKTFASCKTIVLFINKSDVISGTPEEVEQEARRLYRPLIEGLMQYAEVINIKVLVGSARYGHATNALFPHFIEQILPKPASDVQRAQRSAAKDP